MGVLRRMAAGAHTARSTVIALVAVTGVVGALSGCTSAAPTPTPSITESAAQPAAQSESQYSSTALTCAVLETVQTNVENARAAYDDGKLSADQDATIINTVQTTLTLLQRNQNAGLQDVVRNLLAVIPLTPPKVAGATFDPDAAPYANEFVKATTACKDNDTPIGVLAPAGQG